MSSVISIIFNKKKTNEKNEFCNKKYEQKQLMVLQGPIIIM